MSQYQFEDKYKKIQTAKKANPSVSLVKLCADQGVTYQSYNNWFKKHQETNQVPAHKLRLTIHVSVRELVALISQGIKEVPISIESVLRGLPPHEQSALATELGKLQLESLQSKYKANQGPMLQPGAGPNDN